LQARLIACAALSGIRPIDACAWASPRSKRAMAASIAASENSESTEAGAKILSSIALHLQAPDADGSSRLQNTTSTRQALPASAGRAANVGQSAGDRWSFRPPSAKLAGWPALTSAFELRSTLSPPPGQSVSATIS
jgi:hypothetical protein